MNLLNRKSWCVRGKDGAPNKALLWNDTFNDCVMVLWPVDSDQLYHEYCQFNPRKDIKKEDVGETALGRFVSCDGYHCIAFDSKRPSPGIIAHEALHFVNFLLDDRGIKADAQNDEAHAYMVQWVVDRIYALTRK